MRTITTTIDIAASPDEVWQVLTSFSDFSKWSEFIVKITGKAVLKTQLRVLIDDGQGPMTFKPILTVLNPVRELRWLGSLGGMGFLFSGEHYFQLEDSSAGHTRLVHGENFSGLLVPLLWRRLNINTRAGFARFNMALKHRVEFPE